MRDGGEAMAFDIKERRKELGLSLEQLAKRVGVSTATVSRWERGDIKSFKASNIVPLSSALEVRPSELLTLYPSVIDEMKSARAFPLSDVFSKDLVRVDLESTFSKELLDYLDSNIVNFIKENYKEGFSISDFLGDDVQKLIIAWHEAPEKDKKAVSYILGFDYDPKPDNSNVKNESL